MKKKKEIDAIAGRPRVDHVCPECGVSMYKCPVCREYYCDAEMCPIADDWHAVECQDPTKGESRSKHEDK